MIRRFVLVLCALLAIAPARADAQTVGAQPTQAPARSEYVLHRGDEISIKVFGHAELDDTVIVRPDGRISSMLVDEVEAAGLTTSQLDDALTERYTKFFRDPAVTVIVRTFAAEKVFVGGEVGTPGMLPLTGDMTVLSAIVQAGGFKRTARPENVIVLHNAGGRAVAEKLNLKVTGRGVADRALQPFDVVFVPMSRIAKVDAFVDQFIRQLIPVTVTTGFTYLLGDSTVLRVPQ